jgi:hypothetical protein
LGLQYDLVASCDDRLNIGGATPPATAPTTESAGTMGDSAAVTCRLKPRRGITPTR